MVGVRLPSPVTGVEHGSSTFRSVLSTARRSVGVPRAILTVGLLNGVLAGVAIALLPLAEDRGPGYGTATAWFGFGALGAPLLGRLGRSAASRTRLGLLTLAGALALVPLLPHHLGVLVVLAIAGAAAVHVEGAVTEVIHDRVPDTRRAGTLGLTDSVMVAAAMLGSLVAPPLAAWLGARELVALLAATCVAAAVVPDRLGEAATGTADPQVSSAPPRVPRQRRGSRPAARSLSGAAPRG
jgi:predicted MFS family arabinose efflux permease